MKTAKQRRTREREKEHTKTTMNLSNEHIELQLVYFHNVHIQSSASEMCSMCDAQFVITSRELLFRFNRRNVGHLLSANIDSSYFSWCSLPWSANTYLQLNGMCLKWNTLAETHNLIITMITHLWTIIVGTICGAEWILKETLLKVIRISGEHFRTLQFGETFLIDDVIPMNKEM